jgi:hypothetical protein
MLEVAVICVQLKLQCSVCCVQHGTQTHRAAQAWQVEWENRLKQQQHPFLCKRTRCEEAIYNLILFSRTDHDSAYTHTRNVRTGSRGTNKALSSTPLLMYTDCIYRTYYAEISARTYANCKVCTYVQCACMSGSGQTQLKKQKSIAAPPCIKLLLLRQLPQSSSATPPSKRSFPGHPQEAPRHLCVQFSLV